MRTIPSASRCADQLHTLSAAPQSSHPIPSFPSAVKPLQEPRGSGTQQWMPFVHGYFQLLYCIRDSFMVADSNTTLVLAA